MTTQIPIHPSYAAGLEAARAWNALPAAVRVAVIEQGATLPADYADWPRAETRSATR